MKPAAVAWQSACSSEVGLDDAQNHLIERLPQRDRAPFLSLCDRVPLVFGAILAEQETPSRHVYFPIDGFVSLLAVLQDHPSLEVGMVGREGMVGASLILGVSNAPLRALVQGEGMAWRLDAAAFKRELARSIPMQRQMRRYVHVLMTQMVASAGCLRFHLIGQRLARWLLMSQDRAHSARFPVTHEFLASMLGVRRVGITMAAGALQREGFIRYHRGEVTVLDRAGLEGAACGCYAADRRTYAGQFP